MSSINTDLTTALTDPTVPSPTLSLTDPAVSSPTTTLTEPAAPSPTATLTKLNFRKGGWADDDNQDDDDDDNQDDNDDDNQDDDDDDADNKDEDEVDEAIYGDKDKDGYIIAREQFEDLILITGRYDENDNFISGTYTKDGAFQPDNNSHTYTLDGGCDLSLTEEEAKQQAENSKVMGGIIQKEALKDRSNIPHHSLEMSGYLKRFYTLKGDLEEIKDPTEYNSRVIDANECLENIKKADEYTFNTVVTQLLVDQRGICKAWANSDKCTKGLMCLHAHSLLDVKPKNVCRYFQKSAYCRNGERCKQLHTVALEDGTILRAIDFNAPEMDQMFCPEIKTPCRFGGNCRNKDTTCQFDHNAIGSDDASSNSSGTVLFSKIRTCKFGAGCRHKDTTCTFLHPDPESVKSDLTDDASIATSVDTSIDTAYTSANASSGNLILAKEQAMPLLTISAVKKEILDDPENEILTMDNLIAVVSNEALYYKLLTKVKALSKTMLIALRKALLDAESKQPVPTAATKSSTSKPATSKHAKSSNPVVKTVECKDFQATNRCRFGDNCHFLHTAVVNTSGAEVSAASSHRKPKKACSNWIEKGRCAKGDKCGFAHDPATAKKPPAAKNSASNRPSIDEA